MTTLTVRLPDTLKSELDVISRKGELQAKWIRRLGSSENSFMGRGSL